jgi:hypothetical protein
MPIVDASNQAIGNESGVRAQAYTASFKPLV